MADESFTFNATIAGADEVVAKFNSVTHDVRYKGGRFAGRKAAKVIELAAKFGAQEHNDPATRESIAANVTTRFSPRLFKRSGDIGFRIGVSGGAKAGKGGGGPGGDTWYWRLIEFGVTVRNPFPGRPFMQNALRATAPAATEVFVREYGKALDRAIKRARKAAAAAGSSP